MLYFAGKALFCPSFDSGAGTCGIICENEICAAGIRRQRFLKKTKSPADRLTKADHPGFSVSDTVHTGRIRDKNGAKNVRAAYPVQRFQSIKLRISAEAYINVATGAAWLEKPAASALCKKQEEMIWKDGKET